MKKHKKYNTNRALNFGRLCRYLCSNDILFYLLKFSTDIQKGYLSMYDSLMGYLCMIHLWALILFLLFHYVMGVSVCICGKLMGFNSLFSFYLTAVCQSP